MKNLLNMSDLECAKEIYELNLKLPKLKDHLQQSPSNQNILEEYNIKTKRLNKLVDRVNYDNINFQVDAATFIRHIKKFLRQAHNNLMCEFFRRKIKDSEKDWLEIWIYGTTPIRLKQIDRQLKLDEIVIDLKDKILHPVESYDDFDTVFSSLGINNIYKALFNSLEEVQTDEQQKVTQ